MPGRPDIVLPRYHTVVFMHGCFWHRHGGCKQSYKPKSRVAFWTQKFDATVARDRRVARILRCEASQTLSPLENRDFCTRAAGRQTGFLDTSRAIVDSPDS